MILLRYLRKAQGITQRDIVRHLEKYQYGCSTMWISKCESGKGIMDMMRLEKVAELLHFKGDPNRLLEYHVEAKKV